MIENKGFMYKAARGVVKSRRIILLVFAALIVFSAFSIGWIDMEEDITYYLQDNAEAKKGLLIMNEEFTMFDSFRVMVKDVSESQAQSIADYLSTVDGVYMLTYDGSSEDYYHDDIALFEVMLNCAPTDPAGVEAKAEIEHYLDGFDYSLYSAYADINVILVKEMTVVTIIVAIVVVAVLIFTSSTYGELLPLLATFLTAAIVNMGTNFLLGTISLISNTITIVIQLALSVDYAIIFCNRFKEEHAVIPSVEEAVISALSKAIPEISASSLTTIAGLAAMTFMQFRLGADMGIVLIKSIVVALLTVFLFMPAMLVSCGRLMDRTKHRNFVPKVSFLGRFAYAGRFIIPFVFVGLVILGYIGYGKSYYDYSMYLMKNTHKNEVDIARESIEREFGQNNMIAVFVPAGDYEKEMAFTEELSRCYEVNSVMGLASVEAMDGLRLADRVNYRDVMHIAGVDETVAKAVMVYAAAGEDNFRDVTEDLENYSVPLIDLFLTLHDVMASGDLNGIAAEEIAAQGMDFSIDQEQVDMINDLYEQLQLAKKQLQSEQHSLIAVYVDLPVQSDETFDFLDRIHSIADQYYPDAEVVLTGDSVSAKDFADTFESDNRIVSTLSIVLVMLILLFTFKSVGMPILLILVIQGSIWLNFAIPAFRHNYVFFMCFLIVSAIQMGANIDYAIVISSRYTELRREGISQKEAITDSLNLAFPTVITSGLMMVSAGLLIGRMVSQCVIAGFGKYVGTGTAISLVLVNVALPSILIFGDGFARATTLSFSAKLFGANAARNWRRIAAVGLAAASLFTFAVTPIGLGRLQNGVRKAETQTEDLLQRTRELRTIADELAAEKAALNSAKMDFAEHFLTEEIGSEQLEEGRAQYEAGKEELAYYKEQLAAGEREYTEGMRLYEEGLAAYEAGQQELAAGKEEYRIGLQAYEEGKAILEAGQAEYDAGAAEVEAARKLLADAQAQYDAGEAQLAAGKAEYAEGEAMLAVIKPLYDSAVSAHSYYQSLLSRLAAAEAAPNPDLLTIAGLRMEVATAQLTYENALLGRPMESIIKEYEDAQAQLAAGAAEIAAGEKELAEGKIQLDDGYAQMADAEAQLAAGKAELDAGYAQLADAERQLRDAEAQIRAGEAELAAGEAELAEARAQLDAGGYELYSGANEIKAGEDQLVDAEKQLKDGVDLLNENRQALEDDLSELDSINDTKEKLDAGMGIIRAIKPVMSKAGYGATDAEICAVAENYFEEQLSSLHRERELARLVSLLLLCAAACAMAGLLFHIFQKRIPSVLLVLLGMLGALVSAFFWKMGCPDFGMLSFWAAVLLTVFCAVALDSFYRAKNAPEDEYSGRHQQIS